jgi:4a-hydroxytetrahydrobiopterin dehydratase
VIFRGAVDMKLSENEIQKILKESLQEWNYDGKYIVRHINTKNFKETMIIINLIAGISEAHFHHPDIEFGYKKNKSEADDSFRRCNYSKRFRSCERY